MANKRMTFALTFGGTPKVSVSAINRASMKTFSTLMNNTVSRINRIGEEFPKLTNDMRRLDPAFNQYGKLQLKNFQDKFIKNPRNWPRLEASGIKIRRYKLNPNELKNDILDSSKWITIDINGEERYAPVKLQTSKNKDIEPVLTKFFNSLPKIVPSNEANVTSRKPLLLFTGNLKNSMVFDYQKRTYRGKKSTTFRRVFKYGVTSPYAEAHFTGGMIDKPVLVIKRRSTKDGRKKFEFKFIIPIQFAKYFRRLNLGEGYEVSVEMKKTRVHERNPFIFNKNDKDDYKNFILMISDEIKNVEFNQISAWIKNQIKKLRM